MTGYWFVQLGYASAFCVIVLLALRRYKRETGALVEYLLADLDRRATDENPPAAPSEPPGAARTDKPVPALPIAPAQFPVKVN